MVVQFLKPKPNFRRTIDDGRYRTGPQPDPHSEYIIHGGIVFSIVSVCVFLSVRMSINTITPELIEIITKFSGQHPMAERIF